MSFRIHPAVAGATIGAAIGVYYYGLPGYVYGVLSGGFLTSAAESFLNGDRDLAGKKVAAAIVSVGAIAMCHLQFIFNKETQTDYIGRIQTQQGYEGFRRRYI